MYPALHKRRALLLLLYSIAAACCYCFFASILLRSNDEKDAWWLYVGNVIFMLNIFIYTLTRQKKAASVTSLLAEGHFCTIVGILFSIVIIYLIYIIFLKQVSQEMIVMIMINCFVGNFATGAFIALLTTNAANSNEGNNTG